MEDKHVSHVSRALKELRTMGLVEQARSESRNRYYRATSQGNAIAYVLARIMK
jgi:DNA-binding transcriptional ArsR family regulator